MSSINFDQYDKQLAEALVSIIHNHQFIQYGPYCKRLLLVYILVCMMNVKYSNYDH